MQLPSHSWAFSEALSEALSYRLSKIAVPHGGLDVKTFFQRLLGDKRTHDLTHDDMCSAFSEVVREKTKISHADARGGDGSNVSSLAAAREIKHGGVDLNKITVDEILDAHAKVGSPKRPTGSKMIDVGEAVNISKLSTEAKIYGGMSLLMAGLSAIGAVNGFSRAVSKDENGQNKIQWSNVGIGMVSAALAAGSAYIAHQQLRAPAHIG